MAYLQGYQPLEQRDSKDMVVKKGVVSKRTPFATSDNSGIYDTIAENFRFLNEKLTEISDDNNLAKIRDEVKAIYNNIIKDDSVGSAVATVKAQEAEASAKEAESKAKEAKEILDTIKGSTEGITTTLGKLTSDLKTATEAQEKINTTITNLEEIAKTATDEANLAKAWAVSKDSPDNEKDPDSNTGSTMSSKSWAMYSKEKAMEVAKSASDVEDYKNNAQKYAGDAYSYKTQIEDLLNGAGINLHPSSNNPPDDEPEEPEPGNGSGGSGILTFPTIESLKSYFGDLEVGTRFHVKGYYKEDDGGGADYVVCEPSDKKTWLIPLSNGKCASIIESVVNYRMFGAKLDGKSDDCPAMVQAHKYADSLYNENETGVRQYFGKVANHDGIIYKAGHDAINCVSDVDLSGSTLIVNDTNAAWFGIYLWGDAESNYWSYQFMPEQMEELKKDQFYLPSLVSRGEQSLPANSIIAIEEDPYCARDDAGYLYTVPRRELFVHDADGICTPALTDDWYNAGGQEINCVLTDYDDHSKSKNMKSVTHFKVTYGLVPNRHAEFVGCDVRMDVSPDKYVSVMWCKQHNCTVRDWVVRTDSSKMHNKKFRNTMFYIWGSYNVTVKNIQGFDNCGKKEGGENATSGYVLRLTKCLDVHVEDCRMNGYWGCTAMDSVKNIHFYRCHMNRLDIHDYFANLYATDCFFYNHGIQIGYGRGVAKFEGCSFFYNNIPNDCYPSAHMVEFDLTYGRSFEGSVYLDKCKAVVHDAPDGEYSIFKLEFSPNATSVTQHYILPNFFVRDLDIQCDNPNVHYSFFKVSGSRHALTGVQEPTHSYGLCHDGNLIWEYVGKTYESGGDAGSIIRTTDRFLDEYKKTQFYNVKYYQIQQFEEPEVDEEGNPVVDKETGEAITTKVNKQVPISDPEWLPRHEYNVGDLCVVTSSYWFPSEIYRCVKAGISNGYYPTHTSGTKLEGAGDSVSEPDDCWWTFVAKANGWYTPWSANMSVSTGQRIVAEGRIYEVVGSGTLIETPPYDTAWFGTHFCGTAELKFIGQAWKRKSWYAKGSYCIAGDNVYQCDKHDGTTRGDCPVKGNPYLIDGDIIWAFKERA